MSTPMNSQSPLDTYPKPIAGFPIVNPATSDEFNLPALGLQWQWNHNPDNANRFAVFNFSTKETGVGGQADFNYFHFNLEHQPPNNGK